MDFAVEAATGIATIREADENGKTQVESEHIDLPDDLANGFVGTSLLNVPPNTAPFRIGILAPVFSGAVDSHPELAGGRATVSKGGTDL
jgi:hypothetical protein